MRVPFTKMHGCGNDFVVLDGRDGSFGLDAAAAAALADRNTGIGCDQVIVLGRPRDAAAAFMRIHNPDGSESGTCGNATRCVAAWLADRSGLRDLTIETASGTLAAWVLADGQVRVDMGAALLDWTDVPLARPLDTLHLPLPGDPAALSMGNPHATWFVADVLAEDIPSLGPARERDPLFPARANIGFAQILDRGRLRLRVWERGTGLTRACGSGACAAAVNAARRDLTERQVEVVADGGSMTIEWRQDGHVLMTGPVATAFTGTIDLPGRRT